MFKTAYQKGKIILCVGTTNAYIAEELGLLTQEDKRYFAAGIISGGLPCVTAAESRLSHICLENGQRVETPWEEFLNGLGRDDVFIKGANAFDASGAAGVLIANPNGGTVGASFGILAARGSQVIIPVGHEKMIPSCQAAAKIMGINRIEHSLGLRCGFAILPFGEIYTEVDALNTLFGVDATVVGAGGVDGSEGSVMLAVEAVRSAGASRPGHGPQPAERKTPVGSETILQRLFYRTRPVVSKINSPA